MFHQERRFTVFISATEYKQLCSWVLKFNNLETGGDLFGLWRDKHTAVVQLVLGPGKGCRRTSTSFYQDVQYLGNVGSYLTHKEGLCHIGEWHSHHKLGLTRPSGGDENTVWSNMPGYGLSRFILFIATIGRNDAVNVGCFLFETDTQIRRRYPVLPGKFELLQEHSSPFRLKAEVGQIIQEKAESLNTDIDLLKMEESKNDFLVSKSRRVTERSTKHVKRIRPDIAENVAGGAEEQPWSNGTPQLSLPGARRNFTDGQEHPFSLDAPQEPYGSGSTFSRKENRSLGKQELDQKTSSICQALGTPGSTAQVRGEDVEQREKLGAEGEKTTHNDEEPNSGHDAAIMDEPETPSGTVQQLHCTMQDNDLDEKPAPGLLASIASCFGFGKRKSK